MKPIIMLFLVLVSVALNKADLYKAQKLARDFCDCFLSKPLLVHYAGMGIYDVVCLDKSEIEISPNDTIVCPK